MADGLPFRENCQMKKANCKIKLRLCLVKD